MLELGARLALPGFVNADGSPAYPGGYPDYIVNHMHTENTGPLAGWRGADGGEHCTGGANPQQLQRYIENGCFWRQDLPADQRYFKFANRAYLDLAHRTGWINDAGPIVMQLYSEPLQRFRLAAAGHGPEQPPAEERERIAEYFDPLPFWYPPLEGETTRDEDYPLHALTQRPMHMYHSWGSQNPWLRQLTAQNRLFIHRDLAASLQLADDDWALVESPHGEIKVQVKSMLGVNPNTVWTWNAIGKRKGTWALSEDAPEAERGFLLNHLISELLPAREDGHRYSNSDPVTGQAAWFDLRVRVTKCEAPEKTTTQPQFAPLPRRVYGGDTPEILRYGAELQRGGTGTTAPTHREFLGNPGPDDEEP
jgi:anaerobic selenocysteine-containing dehydrogenase